MNLKHLYLLTGVLSVAAIVTYFIRNADSSLPADPRIGEAIVSNEALQGVNRIVIHGSRELALQRSEASGQWTAEGQHGLPVDLDRLGQTVSALAEATLERLVSANPERIAALGFTGSGISFHQADGSVSVHVEVGRLSDSGKQLVRYAGEDKAFLASDAIRLETDALAWLDKSLVSFPREATRAFEARFPSGDALTASRADSSAEWTAESELPSGMQLDQDAVSRAASRFADLSFTALAELDNPDFQAAMAHARHFTIRLEEGTEYGFEIGRRPAVEAIETEGGDEEGADEGSPSVPAGPVFVRIRSSDSTAPINAYMERAAFEIGSYHFTSLPQALEDLLEDQPEPEDIEEAAAPEVEFEELEDSVAPQDGDEPATTAEADTGAEPSSP